MTERIKVDYVVELLRLDRRKLLNKLYREVLSKRYELSLPRNLSDEWLSCVLAYIPEDPKENDGVDEYSLEEESHFAVISMLIENLLEGQGEPTTIEELEDVGLLKAYFLDYLSESVCEYDFRANNIYYEQADLHSILKSRTITIVKLSEMAKYVQQYEVMDNVEIKQTH